MNMPQSEDPAASHSNASESVRTARQIDEVCDQFEAAWSQGSPPKIEEFLLDLKQIERLPLVAELLLLEVYFRQRAGELPQVEDYFPRFPELGAEALAAIVQRG